MIPIAHDINPGRSNRALSINSAAEVERNRSTACTSTLDQGSRQ